MTMEILGMVLDEGAQATITVTYNDEDVVIANGISVTGDVYVDAVPGTAGMNDEAERELLASISLNS